MSGLDFHTHRDSDEVASLKQALSNKDNQYVNANSELRKRESELEEMTETYNEVLRKLQQEADQRHQLQHSLADLQRIYNNELTLRHNAELALSAAHGQIKEKEKASYDLLAEIHHLTSQQDALASTQATLQQENKRLLLRIEELKVNNEHLGRSVNAPKPQANPVDDRVALMQHQLSALQEAHRQQTNELRSTAERLQRAQALHNQATNELAATQRRHQTELDRIQGDAGEKEQELIDLRNHAESAYEHEQQLLRRIEEEESKAESLELMLRKQSDELRSKENADKALKAAERKADVELRRAEELEQQITRLHDDIQSARSSAETEQARTQELTDRYTQLEQTHRGAQQEKSALASQIHELAEENGILRQHRANSSNETSHVERVLVSLDRIRGERDELKRQLEFLSLEARMTQQQLEKEREQALNGHLHNTDTQSKHALNHVEHMATVQQLERRAQALAILSSRTEAQRDAVMTEFDALHQQHNDLREHATRLQEERHALREESEDLHEQLLQAQDALDEARSYLDETKTSLDDVTTQRREINLDLYDAKASLIEGQQKIQDLEHALIYTRKELEEAVSQRNSLNVHVANVEHDLEVAKEQLQEAELRYSTLQGEQLATLSAEALPKHLKAQLQQLEARLERRTKEKENLIHDNKRLDTNMRLQEERLAEISEELEKAQRENEAMIEDCASTRESRDDALRQVEDMGVEIDAMDMEVQEAKARLAHVESSNQQQVHTLVLVLADAATRSQSMTNVLKTALERRNSAISTLSARINALVDENTRLVQITDAQVARQEEAGAESQYLRSHIAQLDADALIRDGDLRSFTLALAVSCQQQRHQRTFLQDFNNARQTMRSRIATLQQGLEDHRSRLALVMPELEALRTTGHESTQTFAMRERELQADISRLELSLGQLQSAHGQAGHDFAVVKAENDVLVVKVAQFEAEKERLSRELDTAVSQQNANKEDLHEQLESLAAERDALIQKYDSLVDEHRTSMQELSEAQQRLIDSQAAQQPLQARHDELTQQLAAVQAETSTQLNDLESKLAAALRHATQADAALEEASQAQRILEDELTRARQELQRQVDDLTTSHPSTEDMDELRASYTEQLIQAQSHLEEAKARAQDAAQKLDESNRLRMTLETQRREDQDRHLSSYGELETAHRTAQQELAAHCARLEEAQSVTAQQRLDLENLNQVVMRLSSESNNLRSSHQDLQNQLTQKNDLFIATQNQLRQLQDSFEQTAQAQDQANVDLEERDRQLASVRVAIEEKAALEETLADLKAQYDDQIARAQQMLQDIEANDDHLLRLKKERDTFERKAASLTRKNEKLQTKLEAALAAAAAPHPLMPTTSEIPPPQPPFVPTTSSKPQARPSNPSDLVSRVTTSHQATHANAAPSSSRLRTPEPSTATTLSSRTKTPEPSSISAGASSTVGKKRPLPPDFEECDNVPPQAYTPDSRPVGTIPSSTNRTRTPAAHRGGFTPVRRPAPEPASPPRSTATILDVTNSPRSAAARLGNDHRDNTKAQKKGWLPRPNAPEPQPSRSTTFPRRQ